MVWWSLTKLYWTINRSISIWWFDKIVSEEKPLINQSIFVSSIKIIRNCFRRNTINLSISRCWLDKSTRTAILCYFTNSEYGYKMVKSLSISLKMVLKQSFDAKLYVSKPKYEIQNKWILSFCWPSHKSGATLDPSNMSMSISQIFLWWLHI